MTKMLRVLALAASLLILPLAARAEIFMRIQGVEGDATARGHEKWIRVSSLDWAIEADTSYLKGTDVSIAKPNPDSLHLVLPTGAWSPQFLKLIATGRFFPNVVIDAMGSDGRPLYRVTVEQVYVTQYRLADLPAAQLPQDYVSLVFKRANIEYYAVTATGSVTRTSIVWDISAGTATTTP